MRHLPESKLLLTILFTVFLCRVNACAQDFPLGVVSHWQYYNNAGTIALKRGDYATAELKFDAAIAILRPYQTIDQRLLARSFTDLAQVLYYQKRYAEAEPLAKWALQVRETQSKSKPEARFQSLFLLAMIHRAQHHGTAAVTLFQRALALQEQAFGRDHYQVALTLEKLAGIFAELGNSTQAEILFRRAMAIHEKFNPSENIALAKLLEHYAAFLRQIDRTADAESQETRARKIRSSQTARRVNSNPNTSTPGFQGFEGFE